MQISTPSAAACKAQGSLLLCNTYTIWMSKFSETNVSLHLMSWPDFDSLDDKTWFRVVADLHQTHLHFPIFTLSGKEPTKFNFRPTILPLPGQLLIPSCPQLCPRNSSWCYASKDVPCLFLSKLTLLSQIPIRIQVNYALLSTARCQDRCLQWQIFKPFGSFHELEDEVSSIVRVGRQHLCFNLGVNLKPTHFS